MLLRQSDGEALPRTNTYADLSTSTNQSTNEPKAPRNMSSEALLPRLSESTPAEIETIVREYGKQTPSEQRRVLHSLFVRDGVAMANNAFAVRSSGLAAASLAVAFVGVVLAPSAMTLISTFVRPYEDALERVEQSSENFQGLLVAYEPSFGDLSDQEDKMLQGAAEQSISATQQFTDSVLFWPVANSVVVGLSVLMLITLIILWCQMAKKARRNESEKADVAGWIRILESCGTAQMSRTEGFSRK